MRRSKMKKSTSRRLFRKTATRVNKKNGRDRPQRGGYRL